MILLFDEKVLAVDRLNHSGGKSNLAIFTKFWYNSFSKINLPRETVIMKNTSISLNDHHKQFIDGQVNTGNYASVSEVIRAGLRMLEEHEMRVQRLRAEIQKGLNNGIISGEEHHKRFAKWREGMLKSKGAV